MSSDMNTLSNVIDLPEKKEIAESQQENEDLKQCLEVIPTFGFDKKTWREDIALIVEGKTLYAAKNVLALVSPVFNIMFEADFQEKQKGEIELPGKKYQDVIEFLCCVYPNIATPVTKDNVLTILPLADEYQVEQLKGKCQDVLIHVVDEDMPMDELLDYFLKATDYNLEELKQKITRRLGESETASNEQRDNVATLNAKVSYLLAGSEKDKEERIFQGAKAGTITFTIAEKALVATFNERVRLESQKSIQTHIFGTIWTVIITYMPKCLAVPAVPASYHGDWTPIFGRSDPNQGNIFSCTCILKCYPPVEHPETWSYRVATRMVLLNKFGKGDLRKDFQQVLNRQNPELKYENFISSTDLMDKKKGYLVDGKVIFEVHFLVEKLW